MKIHITVSETNCKSWCQCEPLDAPLHQAFGDLWILTRKTQKRIYNQANFQQEIVTSSRIFFEICYY